MRVSARAEAVAVLAEAKITERLQRLLDQPIRHLGMPSLRSPSAGFGIVTHGRGWAGTSPAALVPG